MRSALLVVVLVLPVAAAPLPPVSDDAKLIQGTWTVVSFQSGIDRLPANKNPTELVVKGDMLTVNLATREEARGKIKLNMAKKPKELDLTIKEGNESVSVYFIYELDGDNLKLCWRKPGGTRPTAFTADGTNGFMVLKRKR
jgi:uncharacterized protein (TIGR03067 family)